MKSDLIDEQTAARVLACRAEIIAGALAMKGGDILPSDRAAATHLDGAHMAAQIHEYLDVVHENHEKAELKGAATVARLRDYAQQFEAYHLDQLDRLNPA